MEPNPKLVTVLTFVLTNNGAQVGLANALQIDPGFLAKIKNGAARWPDPRLSLALQKLNEWAVKRGSEQFVLKDFYAEDPNLIIEKLSLHPDERILLLAKLRLRGGLEFKFDPALKNLFGSWANLYICTNPNKRSERALAVDNFEIAAHPTDPSAAALKHTNYEHADGIIPEGSVRIRHNTIEIDIDFKEPRFPRAKYLAPMPQTEKFQFILTASIDIKASARTVIARPTLLVRVDHAVDHPGIFFQDSALFVASKKFFTKFAKFDESRVELCPARDVSEDDCDEVVSTLRDEWQKRRTNPLLP